MTDIKAGKEVLYDPTTYDKNMVQDSQDKARRYSHV